MFSDDQTTNDQIKEGYELEEASISQKLAYRISNIFSVKYWSEKYILYQARQIERNDTMLDRYGSLYAICLAIPALGMGILSYYYDLMISYSLLVTPEMSIEQGWLVTVGVCSVLALLQFSTVYRLTESYWRVNKNPQEFVGKKIERERYNRKVSFVVLLIGLSGSLFFTFYSEYYAKNKLIPPVEKSLDSIRVHYANLLEQDTANLNIQIKRLEDGHSEVIGILNKELQSFEKDRDESIAYYEKKGRKLDANFTKKELAKTGVTYAANLTAAKSESLSMLTKMTTLKSNKVAYYQQLAEEEVDIARGENAANKKVFEDEISDMGNSTLFVNLGSNIGKLLLSYFFISFILNVLDEQQEIAEKKREEAELAELMNRKKRGKRKAATVSQNLGDKAEVFEWTKSGSKSGSFGTFAGRISEIPNRKSGRGGAGNSTKEQVYEQYVYLMNKGGKFTQKDVADLVGRKPRSIRGYLQELEKEGRIPSAKCAGLKSN